MDLERRVSCSIELIRSFARKFGKPWILFSGGKDSLATLLLALDALGRSGIRGIAFIEVTGNTHELNTHYVYEVCSRLGVSDMLIHLRREDLDFFEALERWGAPGRKNRWCWNEFKVRLWRAIRPPVFLAGVKHSDSKHRESMDWSRPKVIQGMIVFSPIHDWTTDDVTEYIRSRGLDLNPCYKLYGHSGNCMYCPFHTIDQIRRTMSDPRWGNKIANALRKMRNEWGRKEARRWLRYCGSKSLTDWLR